MDNEKVGVSIQDAKGVWVFAEQREGKVMNIAFELLGEGSKLAKDLGVELSAVLMGDNVDGNIKDLFAYGADKVYFVENAELKDYRTEPYTEMMNQLIKEYKPQIVLIGATNIGRDLAPRVAGRVRTGLTADCTQLTIDPETTNLLQTRPAFGGNLMATIICPESRPQMATVRSGVMKKKEPDYNRTGEVITASYDKSTKVRTVVKEIVKEAGRAVNLEEAKIIISGGRGLGGPEGFEILEKAAEVLGGVVAASRAAVDSGWISAKHQVGQTGKTVHAKIYIACGISGAIQHLAGMQNSELVIAINKNPAAPIMQIADYGIVGDYKNILPLLIEEIKYVNSL
ncbi:electron transfer flavoprotein subunit alpha/FixB family protein [Geosporobacter ferrireducens]|uniref:Electron transfer flavoprotein subunit alpha n=1 Tax=Geosporobacter ferrireducens TaxID=1424294 RepID=A0A1D8GFX9_9FIRM|nr:electron transfer flavoprotein subunit alpha/FixB family protein [Geosporobacter ferrireducens]AOT69816.1 electron transfer flavoprotein subunit alpha [Geosporobacter ferrireducens]